jgi:hypothetical protein
MSRFSQGEYIPRNPKKYVGKGKIKYRSSWELAFMNFCDNNNHILEWASESIKIPYRNPVTGKQSLYIPDFLVFYQNKHGKKVAELVEIKPKKQSIMESKLSNRDKAIVAVNYAKWDMATKWAKRNGMIFRVVTEEQIFRK